MNTPPDPKPSSVDWERLKELNNQASPSPWHVEPLSQFVSKRDAELIVAMRHSLPSILALSDELENLKFKLAAADRGLELQQRELNASISSGEYNHRHIAAIESSLSDALASLTSEKSRADTAEDALKCFQAAEVEGYFSEESTLEHKADVFQRRVAIGLARMSSVFTTPSAPATSGVEAEASFFAFYDKESDEIELCYTPSSPDGNGVYATPYYAGKSPYEPAPTPAVRETPESN